MSAIVPGTVNAESDAINRDHRGIVKFEGLEDPEYETVRGYLGRLTGQPETESVTRKWNNWDQGIPIASHSTDC